MKDILKHVLLFVTFLFIASSGFSQNEELDSLKKELRIHTKKDTARVTILNALAFAYCSSDLKLAKAKADEANSLSKKLKFTKGEAVSYIVFAKIHIAKSELDDALSDGRYSLKLNEKINNSDGIISSYNVIGGAYMYKSEHEQAQAYFNKALKLAKKTGNKQKQSDISNNLGGISYAKGEFDEAVRYFKKSVELDESLGNIAGAAHSLGNVAVIYKMQGRTVEALDYYNKCLLIGRKNNDKEALAGITLNMGALYDSRKQYQKALEFYNESLELNIQLDNKREITKCLISLGSICQSTNKYDEALDYYTRAFTISKEIDNKVQIATCYEHLGSVNLKMDKPKMSLDYFLTNLELCEELKNNGLIGHAHVRLAENYRILKQNNKALFHGLAAKRLADSLSFLSDQKQANIVLARIYEERGDYKKALDLFKVYKEQSDSLFNKESIEKITQLEYEYKYKQRLESADKREKKLNQTVRTTHKNLEESQQKYLWVIIASLLGAIVLGAIIFYMKLRNEKAKNQNIIIEQKLLRSQMTPHFIFNSLSVLQGMVLNKEEEKSVNYLSKFSKLLRIILENSRDKMVSLSKELAAVENYLALQNLENDSYQSSVIVDDSVDVGIFSVPPMLIQPFVENAIEHAFVNQSEKKTIDVLLAYSNENLTCTITDNGIGIDSQTEHFDRKKNSLSTTITNERLKILSKDSKAQGSLKIEDRSKYGDKGTIVTIVIPHKIQPKQ